MLRAFSFLILSALSAVLVTSCGAPSSYLGNSADTLPYATPYIGSNASNATASYQISASPGTTVSVGQTINLSPVNYTSGDGFTYTQLSPTSPAVTLTAGPNGSANVTSPTAMSVVIEVTDTQNNSSTQVTLQFTGSSSTISYLSCTLTHVAGNYFSGQQVIFNISTNDGEAVEVTSWNPGEPWAVVPPFPLLLPIEATYSYPGPKYVSLTAQGLSSGLPCNGGAALQDLVKVY